MPRRLLQLDVDALADVHRRVREQFGPDAFVVAVDRVTVGGIAGFLAKQHYEVTVDAPDPPVSRPRPSRGEAHVLDVQTRLGIAALLAEADDEEARISMLPGGRPAAHGVPTPTVSTASAMFDDLMDSLAVDAAPAPAVRPVLRSSPGDLVLLIGVRHDPLRVAQAVTGEMDASVCVGGSIDGAGITRIDNRRDALEARAQGVRDGRPVVVAIGLTSGRPDVTADIVRTLAADQIWVVVDAGRKVADTSAWVVRIAEVTPIDAMAVLGRDDTATPDSVDSLGIPIAWVDDTHEIAPARAGSAPR